MTQPAHVKAFVAKFADAARQVETTYGLNPLTTLAQAAMESGWEWNGGGGQTAKSRNNYFGVGGDASLRGYSSALESFMDYGKLLKTSPKRYKLAVEAGYDVEKFCMAIGHSGYKAGTWAQKNKYALDLAWIANNRIKPLYPYALGQSNSSSNNTTSSEDYTTAPVVITAPAPTPVVLPPKKKFPVVPVVIGGALLVGTAIGLYYYNRKLRNRDGGFGRSLGYVPPIQFPMWAKVTLALGVFTVGTAVVAYAAKKPKDTALPPSPPVLPPNSNTNTTNSTIMGTLSTNGILTISGVSINNSVESLPRHKSKRYGKRDLSEIKYIVLHHSAGTPKETAKSMANYHVGTNGWAGIGYHFVIEASGAILQTNSILSVSNHVKMFNTPCIGICFPGNFDVNDNVPTPEQIASGQKLVAAIQSAMGGKLEIVGHKEIARPGNGTACPGKNFPYTSFR